jgi:thioredoxin-like negative regulator of GroEL
MTLTPLPRHAAFEELLRPRRPTEESFFGNYEPWVCVAFTANWCGPCKRLDKEALALASPSVKWYVCDVDENNVSLGYAGLKSIPGFCLIKDGLFKDRKAGASGNQDVLDWLEENGVSVSK